jgi:hypothetical protein
MNLRRTRVMVEKVERAVTPADGNGLGFILDPRYLILIQKAPAEQSANMISRRAAAEELSAVVRREFGTPPPEVCAERIVSVTEATATLIDAIHAGRTRGEEK